MGGVVRATLNSKLLEQGKVIKNLKGKVKLITDGIKEVEYDLECGAGETCSYVY